MRISMKYNTAPPACGNIGDGEVEDYTVNITGSAPTPACDDGIQNGTKTGIDCGGTCAPCSTDICAGVPAYNNSATYSAGDKVVYLNRFYERRTNGGWTYLDVCGTNGRGLEVNTFNSSIKLYPNPATTNILNITLLSLETAPYSIKNMLGQTVKSGALNGTKQIHLNALNTGLYNSDLILTDKLLVRDLLKNKCPNSFYPKVVD